MRILLLLLAAVTVALAALATPAAAFFWKTYQLPMRDGVKLETNVVTVNGGKLPALVDRSPYGFTLSAIADIGLLFGYASVQQEFRGTYQSEGKFRIWDKAGEDFYDTSEWITNQTWSNGKIKCVGASADGISAAAGILQRPPWVDGMALIFYTTTPWATMYPGGAFRYQLIEAWLNGTVTKVPGEAAKDIQLVLDSERPGSAIWQPLNATGKASYVDFPILSWCGWYDIFTDGCLAAYNMAQYGASTPGRARLVVDPLGHCQKAHTYFPKNLIEGRSLLPIFEFINLLKDKLHDPVENTNRTTWYVMGADEDDAAGNYWTTAFDFPKFKPTPFYLSADRVLDSRPPKEANQSDSFVYDPKNPVDTIGGNNLEMPCGPLDQRPVEEGKRSDVFTFTSPVLQSDLYTCGPLSARLYVSTNTTDTDFTVKITDVYPDGTSRLIQDGIVRMRWRFGPTYSADPQLVTPGQVYEVNISLWNTSYVWPTGHRIRVSVSSSNHPRFLPNPNNGLPVNTTGPMLVAENTVYFDESRPSAMILPVVSKDQMPPVGILEMIETNKRMIERKTGEPLDMDLVFQLSEKMKASWEDWGAAIHGERV